jgi:hypothetical protein
VVILAMMVLYPLGSALKRCLNLSAHKNKEKRVAA